MPCPRIITQYFYTNLLYRDSNVRLYQNYSKVLWPRRAITLTFTFVNSPCSDQLFCFYHAHCICAAITYFLCFTALEVAGVSCTSLGEVYHLGTNSVTFIGLFLLVSKRVQAQYRQCECLLLELHWSCVLTPINWTKRSIGMLETDHDDTIKVIITRTFCFFFFFFFC
jgi:hypothetical protein